MADIQRWRVLAGYRNYNVFVNKIGVGKGIV